DLLHLVAAQEQGAAGAPAEDLGGELGEGLLVELAADDRRAAEALGGGVHFGDFLPRFGVGKPLCRTRIHGGAFGLGGSAGRIAVAEDPLQDSGDLVEVERLV